MCTVHGTDRPVPIRISATQRAHQNSLENEAPFLANLIITGLKVWAKPRAFVIVGDNGYVMLTCLLR